MFAVAFITSRHFNPLLLYSLDGNYNTLLVAYHSKNEGTATVGGKEMKLEKSETVEYKTARLTFSENFEKGETLIFSTSLSGVKLDYLKLCRLGRASFFVGRL